MLVVALAGTGWIRKEVAASLLALASDQRYDVEARIIQQSPVSSARNHAMRLAIECGHDYLVMVDDDNPPPGNLLDLCGMGLDVVGAPTPIWCPSRPGERPWYYNALVEEDRPEALATVAGGYSWRPVQDARAVQGGELVEVDALGGGCLVLSARALRAVEAPFGETWNEWGEIVTSEDYEACRKWKAAGLRIWAHFGYVCKHFKDIELTQAMRFSAMAVRHSGA